MEKVEALRRKGALGEALALCTAMIGDTPDALAPLNAAAALSRDLGQSELALDYLRRVAAMDAESADAQCGIGEILDETGDRDGALAAFQDALAADASHVPSHLGLSRIHEAARAAEDAIYHLELALSVDPTELGARERLARLLDSTGRADRAAALRRETLKRARDAVIDAHTRIRVHTPNAPASAADLHRTNWAHALLIYGASGSGLAKFHENRGEHDEAAETYRQTLDVLAAAAEQANAVAGLRRAFQTAAQTFAHCHFELALLLERRGDLAGAAYHLEEAWRARRAPWPEARAKLGAVALKCGDTIADIRDAIAAYRGEMPPPSAVPITRWDFPRRARLWLDAVNEFRSSVSDSGRRRLAILACDARQIQMSFALACVLCARGHRVDFLWMPCLRFERICDPEPRYDEWDERLLAREMAALAAGPLPDGLAITDLRAVPAAEQEGWMVEAAERLAHADLRHRHRRSKVDLSSASRAAQFKCRSVKNLDALRRFTVFLGDTPVDRVILFDGGSMEYGAAFQATRTAGVDAVTWQRHGQSASGYSISVNRTHGDLDMNAIWQADAPHRLSDDRRERVLKWISEHGGGDYRDPKPRGRAVQNERTAEVLHLLDLDSAKPVVGLFPNADGDAAALDRDAAFDSAGDWVMRTVEFFAEHPQWQLVVRRHPAGTDAAGTDPAGEDLAAALHDRWPDLPANFRLVEAEAPLSSYRLLEAVQLGLYHTSTIGLEMAMFGIHAITPARPPYSGFGLTRAATSQDEYFARIDAALSEPGGAKVTQEQIDLAWCFADLYVHDAAKALPWAYRSFWRSMEQEWPMERVLSQEGREKFGAVFAALAGEAPLPDGIVGRLR